jgi:6-phosphofructokinase
MAIVQKLSAKGNFPAVGVPKTIDNDLDATGGDHQYFSLTP